MKKIILLTISAIVLGGLLGCSNSKAKIVVKSEPYTSEEAISRGDIVILYKVYNVDKFDRFLTNLQNNKADQIRITGYTDEGDPIFRDLEFDGKVINYTYDNSNDKFGGSNKGIRTDSCSNVSSEKNAQGELEYTLSGCTRNDSEMSYFLLRKIKEVA